MCLFREIQDTAGARIPQAPSPLWIDSLHSTFPGPGMPEARAGRMQPCHLTPASPKILPLLPHGKSGCGSCRQLSTTMIKLFVRNAPSHTFQGQTPATSARGAQVIPSGSICNQPQLCLSAYLYIQNLT